MKRVLIEVTAISIGLLIFSSTLREIQSLKKSDFDKKVELAKLSKVLSLKPKASSKKQDHLQLQMEAALTRLKEEIQDLKQRWAEKTLQNKKIEKDGKDVGGYKNASLLMSENKKELKRLRDEIEKQKDAQQVLMNRLQGGHEKKKSLMLKQMLYPTVQISGEENVGSGTIIASIERKAKGTRKGSSGTYDSYVLTANHVVRNILNEKSFGKDRGIIMVTIFGKKGSKEDVEARLLIRSEEFDVALLKLKSTERIAWVAQLASPKELKQISIWSSVYAIGCPLGNDPIPTGGFIANQNSKVKATKYWMINAPTYFGNSGGGVFDAKTRKLVAVFSKIYTHGKIRPVVISHMGLVVPLSEIYPWLRDNGYGFLPGLSDE